MFSIVFPIFMVIFIGYVFGRFRSFPIGSDKLLNDYVLYISLPALLFIAVANADPVELLQWEFVFATLGGIAVAYLLGVILGSLRQFSHTQSSLVGMAACYGTTGYMGVPIAVSVFGEQAAVPAAIATILHNIPVIMTVIITHDIAAKASQDNGSLLDSLVGAVKTTFLNPLTLAVIAGGAVSFLSLAIPPMIQSFTTFLAGASGPTALFALGLGLAKLESKDSTSLRNIAFLSPIIITKVLVQPSVTFAIGYFIFGLTLDNIWFIVAVLMSAQPIGAGVYVFANKYNFFKDEVAVSITISLIITVMSLSFLLEYLKT
ncbi:AEC family transporter [Marinomonas mediterranea]|jgi:Predicted permeases|uniref:Auxin Efflux Carrier n=1 Tax=Marinomonas mediterranea (strain ATCC 700492 / JCM 21426 / NBRC 103028 / MMB-1) TaxID=717774 RepID=F2JX55_MARM1|nr:AEC family transporter [Marinomonas mediterranea]ADZ89574.1 Auxin Efflux Carrier [Marinomonas mediterranea MMB-1]WCN07668.1 AEC family transporter [Marinomonas mediterranea]WCN11769.1 AEC family transporter [Marinomonas mediterranea]WCN15817.1 AEC family transporter [Marinomonas mediterranea MMB-1]